MCFANSELIIFQFSTEPRTKLRQGSPGLALETLLSPTDGRGRSTKDAIWVLPLDRFTDDVGVYRDEGVVSMLGVMLP